MRKADKQRQKERRKLEKHRQRYIRKEKKLARKQQKLAKKDLSGWKKTKKANNFNLFAWLNFTKNFTKPKEKASLKSGNGSIGNWFSKNLDKIKIKREKHHKRPETVSISSQAGKKIPARLLTKLRQYFSNLYLFNKEKREARFFKKRLKKDTNKSQVTKFIQAPKSLMKGIQKSFVPKQKKSKLKQYSVGSRDSRYLIGLLIRIREVRTEFSKSVINSTILFVLAFLTVYYINDYVTIYTAKIYDIPAVLYSYRIFWPLYTYSSLYTRQALVATFGMGPFVCLFLAILFLQVPRWLKKYNLNLRLFALWLSFHAFNTVFGGYIAGVITRTGLMYSVEWLFLTAIFDKTEIILLILSVIAMFVLGFFATSYFLTAVNAKILREPRYRIFFLVGNVAIPWILGNLALFLLNLPNNPTELLLIYATSILIIIPVFSNYNSPRIQMMKFDRVGGEFNIGWVYLLITIAAFVYIRMLIYEGISFG